MIITITIIIMLDAVLSVNSADIYRQISKQD
jgi:hypothetical protein